MYEDRDGKRLGVQTMSAETGQLPADPLEHVVQFYRDDDELAQGVSGYLRGGLATGTAVVVLATAAHRRIFAQRLIALGADVVSSQARGDFLALDAAEILDRFLLGGRVDPADFERQVGGMIRRAAAGGRPVRVYGEMMTLLWDAGQVSAALELEVLWNELRQLLNFSLLCAYPARYVAGAEHADALDEVCGLHSAVTGAPLC
jgi:hypothetical protein